MKKFLVLFVVFFWGLSEMGTSLWKPYVVKKLSQQGLEVDFASIHLRFAPLGVALHEPRVHILKAIGALQPGSQVSLKRLDIFFYFFDLLAGKLVPKSLFLHEGTVALKIKDPSPAGQGGVPVLEVGLRDITTTVSYGDVTYRANVVLHVEKRRDGLSVLADVKNFESQNIHVNHVRLDALCDKERCDVRELKAEMPGALIVADMQIMQKNFAVAGKLDAFINTYAMEQAALTKIGLPFVGANMHLEASFDAPSIKDALTAGSIVGKMHADQVFYDVWDADQLDAEASWSFKDKTLRVAACTVQSENIERGGQVGRGGLIQLQPFVWKLGSDLDVTALLEHVHLHTLARPVDDSIYPLDFRMTGKARVLVSQGKMQEVDFHGDCEKFRFDHMSMPALVQLKSLEDSGDALFEVPKITLDAHLNGRLDLKAHLSLGKTQLDVQGRLPSNIRAVGTISAQELGRLAGVPITGDGPLKVVVHWPKITIDTKLLDASYVHLDLGRFQGQIVWDNARHRLGLSQLRLSNDRGQFVRGEGFLQFGSSRQAMHIDLAVSHEPVTSLLRVVRPLLEPLEGNVFIRALEAMTGDAAGTITVGGSIEKMRILTSLELDHARFFGESFAQVALDARYEDGLYALDHLYARKRQGVIEGSLVYKKDFWKWKFDAPHLGVEEFDAFMRQDLPILGSLSVHTSGQGRGVDITSSSRMDIGALRVHAKELSASSVEVQTRGRIVDVEAHLFDQASLVLHHALGAYALTDRLQAKFQEFDFSPLFLLLNPNFVTGGVATLTGHCDLSRRSSSIGVSDFRVGFESMIFALREPKSVFVQEGDLHIPLIFTNHAETLQLDMTLMPSQAVLTGKLGGSFDAGMLEFLTPKLHQAQGIVGVNLQFASYPNQMPDVHGTMDLRHVAFRVDGLDNTFEHGEGHINVKDGHMRLERFQSDLASGTVLVRGELSASKLHAEGDLYDTRLRLSPFQYLKTSGHLVLEDTQVSGSLRIDDGLMREKMLVGQSAPKVQQKGSEYAPLARETVQSFASSLKLQIGVDAPEGVRIDNDVFRDTLFKGKFSLGGTLESPTFFGHAELVHGALFFKQHSFRLQSASIFFDSPHIANPRFFFDAGTDVANTKIHLFASGRPDRMKVELNSTPPMTEVEILSLLAVGVTPNDAKRLSATDLAAGQMSEAASLVLHSLDFNRELEEKTGFQLTVNQTLNPQQGVSAFGSQLQSSSSGTQIMIRRNVNDQISVAAGSAVAGSSQARQFSMDYRVRPDLSLSGVLTNYGASTQTDTGQAQSPTSSYGFDLKFQTRFR